MASKRIKMPLLALILLPSLAGVLLITAMSWRLFDPAVERSSEIALSVMEEVVKTAGSEALSYPMAVGNEGQVKQIVAALADNDLVFAVQVEDAKGSVVARAENDRLPIENGIPLIEYREKLFIETADDELQGEAGAGKKVYLGEAVYQLSPYVLTIEKDRLVKEYRGMIGVLVALGLGAILLSMKILWNSVSSITQALKRIADGDEGVMVDSDQMVSEFQVITRGVNQLSRNIDDARARQAVALNELEEAAEQALKSDRETRSFYETATREIADPVMRVVELLKMLEGAESAQVNPQLILDNAERVKLSVLAMLGKLKEDQLDDTPHEIELGEYFSSLENRYRARFAVQQLGYHVESRGGTTQAKYKVDARTLDIVLEKLLENALTFTPKGEVRVTWRVAAEAGTGEVLNITVRDNGVGIPPEHQGTIFARYSHFETDGKGEQGSGLGLYIAKEITERLGGSLSVLSQVGVGSEFTVTLPVERGREAAVERFNVSGKIALNVGIDSEQRVLLQDELSQHEMVNLHTDTAIEALAVLAQHQVDVLILDELIDDLDVESFVTEARKRQENMLIVVVSAAGGEYEEDYETINKPISESKIKQMLRNMALQRVGGVDYRLIDRLNANKDQDGA